MFAKLFVGQYFGHGRVVALDSHFGIGRLREDRFERAVHDFGDALRVQIEMRGPREIEKARDERVQPVHLGGNVAGELAGERLRALQFLRKHFRRAFDHAERIADFVRETSGKLAESGEALGAAGIGFGAAQLAVGLLEALGKFAVAPDLAAIFHHEAVDEHRREEEEQDADRQDCGALGPISYSCSAGIRNEK